MYYFLKEEDKEEWVTAPALHTRRKSKASGTKYILNQFSDANSFPLGSVCSHVHHSFTYQVLSTLPPSSFSTKHTLVQRTSNDIGEGGRPLSSPLGAEIKMKHSVPPREMEEPTGRSQVPELNYPHSHPRSVPSAASSFGQSLPSPCPTLKMALPQ